MMGGRAGRRLLLLLALALGAVACSRSLEVFVEFEDPAGLRPGAAVYLGEQQVGKVSALREQAGAYLVSLALDPQQTAVLRSGSAARITERAGVNVVMVYNSRRGTAPLADGARLRGLASPLEYSTWQASEVVDYASQSLSQVMASMNEYIESEDWRRQRQDMSERLAQVDQATRDAVTALQADIEALVRELGETAGAANDRLAQRYRDLSLRLEQQMADLAERGQQELVQPLQDFMQAIEPAVEPEGEHQR